MASKDDLNQTEKGVMAILEEAIKERDTLRQQREASIKMAYEVEQILGKALGYPWYKDDQKNFPDATEADGVCVGEHIPETLAAEAAQRITDLQAERHTEFLSGQKVYSESYVNGLGETATKYTNEVEVLRRQIADLEQQIEDLNTEKEAYLSAADGARADIDSLGQQVEELKSTAALLAEKEMQAKQQGPLCARCLQPMSRNPHPNAGKPESYLEIGAEWECVPCLHKALNRKAEELGRTKQQLDLTMTELSLYRSSFCEAHQPEEPLAECPCCLAVHERDEHVAEIREIVDLFCDVMDNSQGVVGWHLNGDVAEWDEFYVLQEAITKIIKSTSPTSPVDKRTGVENG